MTTPASPDNFTDESAPAAGGESAPAAGGVTPAVGRRNTARVNALAGFAWALLGSAIAIAVWWLLTSTWVTNDPVITAMGPLDALAALPELAERGVLLGDTWASLYRLLIGLAVAALLGVPMGLAVGLSKRTELASGPVIGFLRMISPLSWAPVAVALFGIGHEPVIFLVAAAAVWPISLSTSAGVHAIDPGFMEVARSMGATRFEILRVVVLPAIRGNVLSGIRLALGTAWIVLVPAEMLGVRSGLGYQILNARDQLAYDQVIAVILVIGVLGFALDWISRKALVAR